MNTLNEAAAVILWILFGLFLLHFVSHLADPAQPSAFDWLGSFVKGANSPSNTANDTALGNAIGSAFGSAVSDATQTPPSSSQVVTQGSSDNLAWSHMRTF